MLKTVDGNYRKGTVQLSETPAAIHDNTRVLVTFLGSRGIDLEKRGITPDQAAALRVRLAAFAEDWDSPEMAIYDDSDKTRL